MTSPAKMRRGLVLRAYLAVSYLFVLIAPLILRKRVRRGKEHPTRWREKQSQTLALRPKGRLVWLHAVGLGEAMSLRGLIPRMAAAQPELSFLVTSTTVASAQVFARHAPPQTLHQFLPIDAPAYRRRFLDHFQPDLCVWVEQDLWPGFVSDIAVKGIPQAVVAARMNDRSFRSHQKAGKLYGDLYRAMHLVTAQDARTAAHLCALGADAIVTGSLKPAAPVLDCDPHQLAALKYHLSDRFVWAVAPAHPKDIALARAAHEVLLRTNPGALLIIAPRFPDALAETSLPRRSAGQLPAPSDTVWLCDTLGDLGLVYRVCQAVLIGGTFSDIEGHNPWEAAALNTVILHGPRTLHFADDFALLDASQAAVPVNNAQAIADTLMTAPQSGFARAAQSVLEQASQRTDLLAADLLGLLKPPHER